MAAASSASASSFGVLTAARLSERFLVSQPRPYLTLPLLPFPRSALVFNRRRNDGSVVTSSTKKKNKNNNKKKCLPQSDNLEEENFEEDGIEALFRQLEEDLKKDDPSMDNSDDEISEADLARLEHELEEALGEDDELSGLLDLAEDQTNSDDDVEEEEEEERPLKLKNWQLRRLASALKIGRRKTSIKSLAAELCLERAVVLELLREPPPSLVLMSAALPDKVATAISEPETKSMDLSPVEERVDIVKPEAKVREPVHVIQSRWSTQKRLKKVHVETLERVYRRTKRPSNTMISSIVHVTNLPRKRVLKWFEDKRSEEGAPDHHLPYQRSAPETVFSS